jgi:hypothetical protein
MILILILTIKGKIMKKIIIATFLAAFSFTSASADLGVNVGVSGQLGLFVATATENDIDRNNAAQNETRQESEFLALGWHSIFIEKTFADRFFIGIDYVPSALETKDKEEYKQDLNSAAENTFKNGQSSTAKTNKVKVEFSDLTTGYVGLFVTENLYVKAGMSQVDIITKENLGTGSVYGDTSIEGVTVGMGYNKTMDNGVFLRAEGMYTQYDGASLTSDTGQNRISLDNLDGVAAKLSVGKSF